MLLNSSPVMLDCLLTFEPSTLSDSWPFRAAAVPHDPSAVAEARGRHGQLEGGSLLVAPWCFLDGVDSKCSRPSDLVYCPHQCAPAWASQAPPSPGLLAPGHLSFPTWSHCALRVSIPCPPRHGCPEQIREPGHLPTVPVQLPTVLLQLLLWGPRVLDGCLHLQSLQACSSSLGVRRSVKGMASLHIETCADSSRPETAC